MKNIFIINSIIAFVIFGIGLMFLEGIWWGKGKVINGIGNIDNYLFSRIKDKRILKSGDQLAFLVCLITSILTLINGLLFLIYDKIPNFSAIFIFVAIVLSWPVRILFIYSKRNSNYNDVPKIWPFPKQ